MKYALIILAFFATISSAAAQQPLILDKIIARVGSENILYSEVQELFSYAKHRVQITAMRFSARSWIS